MTANLPGSGAISDRPACPLVQDHTRLRTTTPERASEFTIDTYQHVLPGMQADAAKLFEHLIAGDAVLPAAPHPAERRKKPRTKTA